MSKSKTALKRVLPVGALLAALFTSLLLYKLIILPRAFLTTASPENTYTVQLLGQKERPRFPFINRKVHFSVSKSAKPFLSDKYLHSGDWFDPSFEISYPRHTWVNDNVLRFFREEYFSRGTPDTLKVINNTGEKINYLRVTSDCIFLLFDLQPGSMTELSISSPRGSLRWISVEGEHSDGQSVRRNGVDFVIPQESSGPFTYYIYINEDGSKIDSPQLEKYIATE